MRSFGALGASWGLIGDPRGLLVVDQVVVEREPRQAQIPVAKAERAANGYPTPSCQERKSIIPAQDTKQTLFYDSVFAL